MKARDIVVGQMVRVARTNDWTGWTPTMRASVGTVLEVSRFDLLDAEDGYAQCMSAKLDNEYYYPIECLEPAKKD